MFPIKRDTILFGYGVPFCVLRIFNLRVFVIVSFYLSDFQRNVRVHVKHDVALYRKENVVTFLVPVIERVPLVNFFHQSVKLICLREL